MLRKGIFNTAKSSAFTTREMITRSMHQQKHRLLDLNLIKSKKSFPIIFKREINNQEVLDTLSKNPGLTLSEIHRDYMNFEQYITKGKFDSLSEIDKKTLKNILFTYTGFYALRKKYITVDEFLSIPVDARKHLSRFFCDADEIYWGAQMCRDQIDQMFLFKNVDHIQISKMKF